MLTPNRQTIAVSINPGIAVIFSKGIPVVNSLETAIGLKQREILFLSNKALGQLSYSKNSGYLYSSKI